MSSTTATKLEAGFICGTSEGCAFCLVAESSWEKIQASAPLAGYPAGVTLFRQGDSPIGVHLICHGRVKLRFVNEAGRGFLWRVAEAGEVLGISSLLAGRLHLTSAETLEPCLIRFLAKDTFLRVIHEFPQMSDHLLRQVSREYYHSLDRFREFTLTESALERLGQLLFQCSVRQKLPPSQEKAVRIYMSREEMAERVGVAPETVSRLLSQLVNQGSIKRDRGSILILDPDRLRKNC